jgi:hypothetical protein
MSMPKLGRLIEVANALAHRPLIDAATFVAARASFQVLQSSEGGLALARELAGESGAPPTAGATPSRFECLSLIRTVKSLGGGIAEAFIRQLECFSNDDSTADFWCHWRGGVAAAKAAAVEVQASHATWEWKPTDKSFATFANYDVWCRQWGPDSVEEWGSEPTMEKIECGAPCYDIDREIRIRFTFNYIPLVLAPAGSGGQDAFKVCVEEFVVDVVQTDFTVQRFNESHFEYRRHKIQAIGDVSAAQLAAAKAFVEVDMVNRLPKGLFDY